LPYITTVT